MAEMVWIRFRGDSRSATTTTTAATIIPTKSEIRIRELVLADEARDLDSQAGHHQHEDGPDHDQQHGQEPFGRSLSPQGESVQARG